MGPHRLVMKRVHLFLRKQSVDVFETKRTSPVPLGRRVGNQLVHVGGVVTADQHTGLHVCLLAARSRLTFNVRVFSRVPPSPSPPVLRSPTAEFSWPRHEHIGVDAVAEKATAASRVTRWRSCTHPPQLDASFSPSPPPLFSFAF